MWDTMMLYIADTTGNVTSDFRRHGLMNSIKSRHVYVRNGLA